MLLFILYTRVVLSTAVVLKYIYFFYFQIPMQRKRIASLAKFRSGRVKILVATDVASRYKELASLCSSV